jgi:alcohol dehydrogenase class IV
MPLYLISRLRCALNRLIVPLLKFPKPFTLVGPDASLTLCREIAGSGIQYLLLITDKPILKLGLIAPMLDALEQGGVIVEVFSEVEPDPGYETVMQGVMRLQASKVQAVLAVGGGSSIDCAKAIVLCHANACGPAKLTGLWLYALPRKKGLPFYAVPTTAGTGSEVTIAAVVSDKQAQVKYSIIDPKVTPAMVALDPKLTLGLPAFITAPTGMDALTHAVEAYVSTLAYAETDEMARMATASIVHSLPQAYANGTQIDARERMLVASCMAGMAFTRAGVGYIHAIAHQLGGLYHVPHGLANAIVMPHVLDFSKPRCTRRLAELARAAGLARPGASDATLADSFIEHIRHMNASMQIPAVVKELRREDFDTIIDRAFAEAHGTYGVPRYLSRFEARALLGKLLPQAPA